MTGWTGYAAEYLVGKGGSVRWEVPDRETMRSMSAD